MKKKKTKHNNVYTVFFKKTLYILSLAIILKKIKMRIKLTLVIFLFCIISCSNESKHKTSAYFETDPYIETISKSQYFSVSLTEDKQITGQKGVIISLRKNSFINSKKNIVSDVTIELIEMLSIPDMLLSNMTTYSNGKLLETDGMVFINAFDKNGNTLNINPKAPIYVEIPTNKNKSGMMVYDGIRDKNGNMNWSNPKPMKNYLKTVPLGSLNFLPKNYENNLSRIYPFKEITKKFQDSIYFNTPIDTCRYLNVELSKQFGIEMYVECGVLPYRVKAIKQPEFQESFIATKAFERRLKAMRKYCKCSIFDTYVNNLDMNLYEIDSIIASKIKHLLEDELTDDISDNVINEFEVFAKERLLNVNMDDVHFQNLKQFYKNKEKQYKEEFLKLKKQLSETQEDNKAKITELTSQFMKIAKKRESLRMPKYGFITTSLGWKNIDRGIQEKNWMYKNIEINYNNEMTLESVHIYALFNSKKVVTRLIENNQNGNFGFNPDIEAIQIPKKENIVIVAIGSKGDNYFFSENLVFSGVDDNSKMNSKIILKETTLKEIKIKLSKINSIYEDADLINDIEINNKLAIAKAAYQKGQTNKKNLIKMACECQESQEEEGINLYME